MRLPGGPGGAGDELLESAYPPKTIPFTLGCEV